MNHIYIIFHLFPYLYLKHQHHGNPPGTHRQDFEDNGTDTGEVPGVVQVFGRSAGNPAIAGASACRHGRPGQILPDPRRNAEGLPAGASGITVKFRVRV